MYFDTDSNHSDIVNFNQNIGIGYKNHSQLTFIVISSLSMVINALSLVIYIIRKASSRMKEVSMERMLHTLILLETFIGLSWLCNAMLFYDEEQVINNETTCFIASIVSVFVQSNDWIFLTLAIYHLKKIVANPMEGIIIPNMRIRLYLLVSCLLSTVLTLLGALAGAYGRSPMVTCFILTGNDNKLPVICFVCIFTLNFLWDLRKVILMFHNKRISLDADLRKVFYKYIILICAELVMAAPLLLLYAITIFVDVQQNTFLEWLSYFSAVMNCSMPLVIAGLRVCQAFVRINVSNEQNRRKESYGEGFFIDTEFSIKRELHEQKYELLESRILKNFMRDIFIGISHGLTLSARNVCNKHTEDILQEDCLASQDIQINFGNIAFEDDYVRSLHSIDISFIEFAPLIFSNLRRMEGLNEKEMIKSFLPMNNKKTIGICARKSGKFFLHTDDKKFMLKTINSDELDLIRTLLLRKYTLHVKNNPNSLLCRIYGIYKLVSANEDDVIVMLMPNLTWNFGENVDGKYDLKGSLIDRKEDYPGMNDYKIALKELNFEENEKELYLDESSMNRLKETVMRDAQFLSELEIMDYSLFVVKLSFTTSQDRGIAIRLNDSDYTQKHFYLSKKQGTAYIIAIIDYLQTYNFFKFLETQIKYYVKIRPENVNDITCVPPSMYYDRFIKYLNKINCGE